jgi:hypothetical protein
MMTGVYGLVVPDRESVNERRFTVDAAEAGRANWGSATSDLESS